MKRTLDNGRRRQIVSPAPPAAERLERRVLLANDGAAQLVLDIEPATEGSFDSGGMILRVGDSVYLTGEDADSPVNNIVGRELWRSDGQSTTLVKDIAPGQLGSNPENFTAFNGTLFFTVERTGPTTSVAAIWKSDGTAAGTVQATPADARELEVAGDALFFANSSGHLWTTDGTAEGTVPLIQPFPSVTTDSLRGVGRTLFFRSNLRGGFELWKSDGTPQGTVQVTDLGQRRGDHFISPTYLGVIGDDTLLFSPYDGTYGREVWKVRGAPAPVFVSGRAVFYNNCGFDGRDPQPTTADLAAVAPDKKPLQPGQTPSFANVTSYAKGLNGVLIDFAGMPPNALGADDFDFRIGRAGDPANWPPVTPESVKGLATPTDANVARCAITFADGAVRNAWLRVTVKANANTGLAAPDVFFFGNRVGDTGATPLRVDAADYVAARGAVAPRTVDRASRYDFDRDGKVTALDLLTARRALGQTLAAAGAGGRRVHCRPRRGAPQVDVRRTVRRVRTRFLLQRRPRVRGPHPAGSLFNYR